MKRLLLYCIVILLSITAAGATEFPYYIDSDVNNVYVPVDIDGNGNYTLYIQKTDGYTPSGDNVFISYFDENSTGWTEVDPNNRVSFTNDRLEFTDIRKSDKTYVYDSATIPDEWKAEWTFGITAEETDAYAFSFGLSSVIDDLYSNSGDSIGLAYYYENAFILYKVDEGTPSSITDSTTSSKTFYMTAFRDGDIVTVKRYSDAARTTQIDSFTKDVTGVSGLQYYYLISSLYTGSGTSGMSGWIDDHRLMEYTTLEPTVTVTDVGIFYKIDIANNEATSLTDYQISIPTSDLDISADTESLLISDINSVKFLSISVYDESTGGSITPSSVRFYNENTSVNIENIDATTYVSFEDVDSGKYVVSVSKDGYYGRSSIISVNNSTSNQLNVFLPSENETVIYDTFKLTDNTEYESNDVILRLDKPMNNGTETVFSSYFDFASSSATYLIASDQYILYVITPDETISYGWLYPDADGEINIILNDFVFNEVEGWLDYTYETTDTAASFDYTSSKSVDTASFIVSYNNGSEAYNVSAATDTGSFTYVFPGNATYLININVETDDDDTFTMQEFIEIGKTNQRDFFPASFTMLLKSIVVMFGVVVGVIALSSYRADLSAMWAFGLYAFAVYQDWIYGNAITVSILGIIALAAIKKFQRRESRM